MSRVAVLQSIRAIQDKRTADRRLADEQAAAKQERQAAAFRPIMDIWNTVKNIKCPNYRWHSSQEPRAPLLNQLATHSCGVACLTFYEGGGGYGEVFQCIENDDGQMLYRHGYRAEIHTDAAGLQEAFLTFLATRIPKEEL